MFIFTKVSGGVIFMNVCVEERARDVNAGPCSILCTCQTEHQLQEWSIKIGFGRRVFSPCSKVATNHLVYFCACSPGLHHLQSVESE